MMEQAIKLAKEKLVRFKGTKDHPVIEKVQSFDENDYNLFALIEGRWISVEEFLYYYESVK